MIHSGIIYTEILKIREKEKEIKIDRHDFEERNQRKKISIKILSIKTISIKNQALIPEVPQRKQ